MSSPDKITILLADEDALRRDGLAAVLRANAQFEVLAQCPDGESAMAQIRQLQPEVAVVDLNLPRLHGIELVRRIRGEALGTKVVILSGSADEDIIREVVRAGADAYLLKNGPARHLTDAIFYVRDGGQYFSPQLRRDGLDRRLLEEPPRPPAERSGERPADPPAKNMPDEELERRAEPAARDSRYGRRPESRPGGADRNRLRQRLQEDTDSDLGERDYEILNMMAEGIRPILDRLDEIEGRVGEMEIGDVPVPGNVRGWLNGEIADTLGENRAGSREVALGRSMNDLEARLPQLIEEAVTARFHNMANKLQQEIEETHVRTLETFVKNIQVKLVQRVSALEMDMSKQAEAMQQLHQYSQRTEDNLSRLISGVDRLAQDLPKRLAAPAEPLPSLEAEVAEPMKPSRRSAQSSRPAALRSSRSSSGNTKIKIFWGVVGAILLIALVVIFRPVRPGPQSPTPGQLAGNGAAPGAKPPRPPPAGSDTKTRLQAAAEYSDRKDYSMAEDIYKQVLKDEPNNVDAMKALASVLYREDKIEESAAILDKLPRTN
ncbi:MAG: response regulator [Acidobacteriota bacterium]|nr:response regulator [Acidobacteriota bacterium]